MSYHLDASTQIEGQKKLEPRKLQRRSKECRRLTQRPAASVVKACPLPERTHHTSGLWQSHCALPLLKQAAKGQKRMTIHRLNGRTNGHSRSNNLLQLGFSKRSCVTGSEEVFTYLEKRPKDIPFFNQKISLRPQHWHTT